MEERIWRWLLDDIALDVCFEMHERVKTVGMSLDELYDVEPLEATRSATPFTVVEVPPTLDISCSRCQREIHATRYAQHLAKCLNGNRRQPATNSHRTHASGATDA